MKIEMKKKIEMVLSIIMLISLIGMASARSIDINCHYDEAPYFNPLQEIKWICETNETTQCLSFIKKDNGDLLSLNPDINYLGLFGEISYFECPEICTIIFTPDYLMNKQNYTFGVACEDSVFERTVTPEYYLYEHLITGRSVWLVDNILHVTLLLFIVAVIVLAIVWFISEITEMGLPTPVSVWRFR